jgi:hypothetical protein
MIVSIHQPEHMPWPHLIEKIAKSDTFIILDTVQFKKNNVQNRNKLITKDGFVFWSTVPIVKGRLQDTILEKKISTLPWKNKYLTKIIQNYEHEKFFKEVFDPLEILIQGSDDNLCNLNISIINFLLIELNIKTKILKSSELNVIGYKNELLINILKNVSATVYLSGQGSKSYLDLNLFKKNNIKVNFFNPIPWIYPMPHLIQGLSIFDYLFRNGIKKTGEKINEPSKI